MWVVVGWPRRLVSCLGQPGVRGQWGPGQELRAALRLGVVLVKSRQHVSHLLVRALLLRPCEVPRRLLVLGEHVRPSPHLQQVLHQARVGKLGRQMQRRVPLLARGVDVTSQLLDEVAHNVHPIVLAGVVQRRRAAAMEAAVGPPCGVTPAVDVGARIHEDLEDAQVAGPGRMVKQRATHAAVLGAALVAHPAIRADHVGIPTLPQQLLHLVRVPRTNGIPKRIGGVVDGAASALGAGRGRSSHWRLLLLLVLTRHRLVELLSSRGGAVVVLLRSSIVHRIAPECSLFLIHIPTEVLRAQKRFDVVAGLVLPEVAGLTHGGSFSNVVATLDRACCGVVVGHQDGFSWLNESIKQCGPTVAISVR